MKKFAVFAYYHYYPSGGIDDLVGAFDTLDEANDFAKSISEKWDDVYVVDLSQHPMLNP